MVVAPLLPLVLDPPESPPEVLLPEVPLLPEVLFVPDPVTPVPEVLFPVEPPLEVLLLPPVATAAPVVVV